MAKITCSISPYIKAKHLPKAEETRLNNINTEIFARLQDSKLFKKVDGQLRTKSQDYFKALALKDLINQEYRHPVVSLLKAPIGNRKAQDYIAHVNVLPLQRDLTPPTPDQLLNREELKDRFTGLRPTIRLTQDQFIPDQGISQEVYKELHDSVYGPTDPNKVVLDNRGQFKLLQLDGEFQREANNKTLVQIKEVLDKLGVTVERSDDLIKEYGMNAIVDTGEKIIRIMNGYENIALTEEAMHVISRMLPEGVYQDLENEITKYKIYQQTLEAYGVHPLYINSVGETNLEKIKLEAIGKLLAEYYIKDAEDLSPEEVNISRTLWQRVLSWIKSIFKTNSDLFQDVINKLNSGELTLTNQPSRSEILASLAFKPSDIENLSNVIIENAPADTLHKLSAAINTIKDEDMKIIWNNLNKISSREKTVLNRRVTANSGNLLQNVEDAKDIKEETLNIIAYYDSIYTSTGMLVSEMQNIETQLKKGNRNPDGTYTPLTDKQELDAYKAVYHVHQMAQKYKEQLDVLTKLLRDVDVEDGTLLTEFKGVISKSIGNIDTVRSTFETIREKEAKAILDKDAESKIKAMNSRLKTDIDILQTRLDKATSGREIRLIEKEIKKKQWQLDNPISGEVLFEMLADPTNASLYGMYHHYLDGPLTSKNPAIQQVANLIYNKLRESQKEAEPTVNKLVDIASDYFERRGKKPTDLDTFYEPITETVTRYHFEPTTGELQEYEAVVLVAQYNQWEFENEIAQLLKEKYDLKHALTNEIDPDVIEFLTSKLDETNQKLKALYDTYGQDQYTQEYRDIQSTLDVTLSNGKTVATVRKEHIKVLQDLDKSINNLVSLVEIASILDQKDDALFELQRLESIYNVNGSKKTGDELIIAETIGKYKGLKRSAEVDQWYITNSSKDRWEQDKQKIDANLAAAQAQFDANASKANEDNLKIVTKEHETWYRLNTKTELPKQFYTDRNEILAAISILMEPYKAKSDTAKVLEQGIDDLWQDIFNITKGLRDEDGTIIGTDTLDLATEVKFKEEQIEELKVLVKGLKSKMNQEDYVTLGILFKQLEEIQSTPLTKYWDQQVTATKAKIESDLVDAGTYESPDQVLDLFYKSDFFRDNTIEVTDSMPDNVISVPDNIIQVGDKFYKPIYTWRHTVPNPKYQKETQPSHRWFDYKVNPKFKNANHETISGTIAIDPVKAETKYLNSKYFKLSAQDKQMVEQLREIHYNNQRVKPKKSREGDELPRVVATGSQRGKQRLRNASSAIYKKWFTRESWNNIMDINATKLETEYGEGQAEDDNNNKIRVLAKFNNKSLPITKLDRDIFRILTMSTIDAHRYAKMWELVPVLSTIKDKAAKSRKLKKGVVQEENSKQMSAKVDYMIDFFVNSRTKRDTGIARSIREWQGHVQSILALQWLGLPWNLTSIAKNELQGLWQIAIMSPWLKQYSKGSLAKAIATSSLRAWDVVYSSRFSSKGSSFGAVGDDKYIAIVKHLKLVQSVDTSDVANTFKSTGLKTIDNLRFLSGSTRQVSEVHLELAMYELFKQGHRPMGDDRTIEDMYDFVDGKLTAKEGMTSEKEAHITTSVFNMHQFVAGNYSFSNSSLAKAYFWGSALLFMKNYFYNTSQALFGAERTLQNGQTMEGAYRVFWRLMRQNLLRNIFGNKDLTPSEKIGLARFYMHFLVVNMIGGVIGISQSLLNGTDDDDEEKVEWYMTNLARKTYQEMAYFNAVDRAGVIGQIVADKRDVASQVKSSHPFMKLGWYLGAEPLLNKLSSTFVPFDWKRTQFGWNSGANTTDPFYSQYKDDLYMFNLMKSLSAKPEVWYPKSSLETFKYYNESLYDPVAPKKKESKRKRR